ncbi:MAG: DNA adenine methylase, partial [Alishewanella sp. 32-51-5]
MVQQRSRAFLKWAGGKYNLVSQIQQHLPQADCLVEPFVGAGSVFLNTQYAAYRLNDINADLIELYKIVQQQAERYIADARALFVDSA